MAGLKQKHAELESELTTLRNTVASVQDELKQLWRCDDETKELARSLVRESVDKMQAEFGDVKEEMDHKFNLQVAENKRLQGHISELKKENKHLYALLSTLADRVKTLEQEIVG